MPMLNLPIMSNSNKKLGVVFALGSDMAFIGLGIIISFAAPIGAVSIGALRIVEAFPLLLGLLLILSPQDAKKLFSIPPKEWVKSIITASIMGFNIWLFAAAPLWGEADGLAQGYLLLPVCLAALDLVRGEAMSKPVLCGVALATLGIGHTIFSASHLSWVALVIGFSQCWYFDLHKRRGLTLLQRLVSDFGLLTPFCVVALAWYGNWSVITFHWPLALGLGLLTTLAYICYLGASKVLSHTVFGILTLLEPVGLAVIAVVLWGKHTSYLDMALMLLGAVLVTLPHTPKKICYGEKAYGDR